jgi:hypothetical protein
VLGCFLTLFFQPYEVWILEKTVIDMFHTIEVTSYVRYE